MSPFNGKMNALNEINRVIGSVSYYGHGRGHSGFEEDEYLTHDMVSKWLQENDVLSITLKDNLHQPQVSPHTSEREAKIRTCIFYLMGNGTIYLLKILGISRGLEKAGS